MIEVWIIDNRNQFGTSKSSMTEKLINVVMNIVGPNNLKVIKASEYNDKMDLPRKIILSGSDARIRDLPYSSQQMKLIDRCMKEMLTSSGKRIDIFGICYGLHLMAKFFKVPITSFRKPCAGTVVVKTQIESTRGNTIISCWRPREENKKIFYLNHNDYILKPPTPFLTTKTHPSYLDYVLEAVWKCPGMYWIVTQYHPEATKHGIEVLEEWLKSA